MVDELGLPVDAEDAVEGEGAEVAVAEVAGIDVAEAEVADVAVASAADAPAVAGTDEGIDDAGIVDRAEGGGITLGRVGSSATARSASSLQVRIGLGRRRWRVLADEIVDVGEAGMGGRRNPARWRWRPRISRWRRWKAAGGALRPGDDCRVVERLRLGRHRCRRGGAGEAAADIAKARSADGGEHEGGGEKAPVRPCASQGVAIGRLGRKRLTPKVRRRAGAGRASCQASSSPRRGEDRRAGAAGDAADRQATRDL